MFRYTTEDIKKELIEKYNKGEFRVLSDGTKTVEIQNANFIADKDYILREPNYDYAKNEILWYESQSLYVDDIPGKVPAIWKSCADKYGKINSNYGWCIFSEENGFQYKNVLETLKKDPATRQAIMIYNRPSMHTDAHKNGMHDFMCCQNVQYFLNKNGDNGYYLDCVVNFRSNDAVFGYNNDMIWNKYVLEMLTKDLDEALKVNVRPGIMHWNAGSIHVYERHFKYLEQSEEEEDTFIDDFITFGDLRKMIEKRKDTEYVTIKTIYNKNEDYHKPLWLEDSTSVGFWELKCN